MEVLCNQSSPTAPELHILYEDNHCLAVVKPPGLLTQGVPAGIPTLEGMVKEYIKHRYHKPGNVYLGIPHRLDRPVSGVVLFARNSKAASRLAEQFQNRKVRKLYWAVVEGSVEPDQGEWHDWLLKVPEEARAVCVAAEAPGAKEALLRYRKLREISAPGPAAVSDVAAKNRSAPMSLSLLEIEPVTGRMHQIRVQAARRGWPVVGDALYGATLPFGPLAELPRDRIIALHARSLTFLHPIRYEPITLTAPLPTVWSETFTDLIPPPKPL
ncbi:MAG: RluA family pseudouridine synthase [Gemmatales bacterium]|nr:RluA family pseudouridine synthase [Gemmatales bacterium]MDW8385903.1 RluA family pseudouridine synthase [Gemmatales bacterium]